MKKVNIILRAFSFLIDFIIISIPVQLIMLGVLGVNISQADFLFKGLFATYNVLFIYYLNGSSIGKYFSKTKIVSTSDKNIPLIYIGMREVTKTLYLIPVIGWILCAISLALIIFKDGRAIHDYVGETKVIYAWEEVKVENGKFE